jgi:hypothetical protein
MEMEEMSAENILLGILYWVVDHWSALAVAAGLIVLVTYAALT